MLSHLRANLLLLVSTVLICSGVYPLLLWAVAQGFFRDRAQGSIIEVDQKPIGSLLIAQEFKGDEYFQPRPSAASYKAQASGASNYAANNYLLRERVARQLGPIVRYGKGAEKEGKTPGELVGPDVEKWFQKDPNIVLQWAKQHSSVAEGWIKDTDDAVKPEESEVEGRKPGQSFQLQLATDHPILHRRLMEAMKNSSEAPLGDVAQAFFKILAETHPGEWLTVEDAPSKDDRKRKKLMLGKESSDIQGIFFDMWRQAHPDIALEEVPADMVTTSASGLDPHITLKNAQYQVKYRIPHARAKKIITEEATKIRKYYATLDKAEQERIEHQARQDIERRLGRRLEDEIAIIIDKLLAEKARAPLGGLIGVPLVNVLEINVALDQRLDEVLKH